MFLAPHSTVDTKKLLNNIQVFEKDYLWLKKNNMFYDYNSMDDVISNRRNTGHFWQVATFIYNKELLPGLPIEFKNLETVRIIQSLEVKPILGTFSMLKPFSTIDEHEDHDEECIAGVDNTYVIKYHLGIDAIENKSGIIVNNVASNVERGKLHVFNESFPHRVYNNSCQDRCVLILSFLASDLNE